MSKSNAEARRNAGVGAPSSAGGAGWRAWMPLVALVGAVAVYASESGLHLGLGVALVAAVMGAVKVGVHKEPLGGWAAGLVGLPFVVLDLLFPILRLQG